MDPQRSTARTTKLMLLAIAESIDKPGRSVPFVDHWPHNRALACFHAQRLRSIVAVCGLEITVMSDDTDVFLRNSHAPTLCAPTK